MRRVVGTPGKRFIYTERVTFQNGGLATVDEVVFHLDKLVIVPLSVAAGSAGYTVFDSDPETVPATSAFLKIHFLDWPGLEWWFVDDTVPDQGSPQSGPTWELMGPHFQPLDETFSPFSVGSLPAIAFENNTDNPINAVAIYGRF